MQSVWNLQDAKNKLSQVVDAALAGTPQVVSRRGKPSVVVISTDAYNRLLKQGSGGPTSFRALLLSMPQKTDSLEDGIGRADLQLREVDF